MTHSQFVEFVKFPSTPHLYLASGVDVRDDKVMSPEDCATFLHHELVVEEKIDGANLGISFDVHGNLCAQNRGKFVSAESGGQWKKLDEWLCPRADSLFDILSDRYTLFGEWCYACHSVPYDALPDWFLGFDVWDRVEGVFFPVRQRDELLTTLRIFAVPMLARTRLAKQDISALIGQSRVGSEKAEGLYFRRENPHKLVARAKWVSPGFQQAITRHWSKDNVRPNKVVYAAF